MKKCLLFFMFPFSFIFANITELKYKEINRLHHFLDKFHDAPIKSIDGTIAETAYPNSELIPKSKKFLVAEVEWNIGLCKADYRWYAFDREQDVEKIINDAFQENAWVIRWYEIKDLKSLVHSIHDRITTSLIKASL